MRRIGRWLRNGLTGLSVVLCVATVALWVRSYFVADAVEFSSVLVAQRPTVALQGYDGLCRFCRFVSSRGETCVVAAARPFDVTLAGWLRLSFAPSETTHGNLHGGMGFYADGWWPGSGYLYAERWVLDENGQAVFTTHAAASAVIVDDGRQRYLFVPHWFLTLLFAVLPVMGWRRRVVRLRREAVGRCRVCGYDLRASVDRCPECGTAIG